MPEPPTYPRLVWQSADRFCRVVDTRFRGEYFDRDVYELVVEVSAGLTAMLDPIWTRRDEGLAPQYLRELLTGAGILSESPEPSDPAPAAAHA